MSEISDKYRSLILEQIIKDLLLTGTNPSLVEIQTAFDAYLAEHDLNSPQFDSADYLVGDHSVSSAQLYNNTNKTIKGDLTVLYENSLSLANNSMKSFDRWRSEMTRLEGQLDKLENRITGLLLVSQDTTGFFNFVSDNFADTSKVDIDNSSILIDLGRTQVTLGSENAGATRISLNNITEEDTEFIVLTRKNLQSVVKSPGGDSVNAFLDNTKFWQHRVYSSKPQPVSTELKVHFPESITLSRILFNIHAANSNGSLQITPLYSIDGFNYNQLPTETFSQSVLSKATFTFPEIEATDIKFILTKSGFDTIDNLLYVYEFGADEIVFYREGFLPGAENLGTLYSLPLSVKGENSDTDTFNSVSLEACEYVPEGTRIDYSVAASDVSTTDLEDLNWASIDPIERDSSVNPTSINFNDLAPFEFGNTTVSGQWVKPSYDPTASGLLISPGANFNLIDVVGTTESTSPITSSGLRYVLPTNNDVILNHQIKSSVDLGSVIVLRNLGLQDNKSQVRNVQTGWGFSEPYYLTTIEVVNKAGVDINFGDKQVLIDTAGVVGTVHIETGFHLVAVHKSNWIDIGTLPVAAHNIAGMKSIDPLYPFNHKFLIEGYVYPNDFIGETVYSGVDLFAEAKLVQVSPFDILNNVQANDYKKFALDADAKEGARDPSKVIIVKIDTSNPDFQNEKFVVRLTVNTSALTFKYVWLRAELSTEDAELAPILEDYRIRLAK